MKNLFLRAFFLLFIAVKAYTQINSTIVSTNFYSEELKSDWSYTVYLPAGYDEQTNRYPVFYLLHGITDNHQSWVKKGKVKQSLDFAIQKGIISPMIIVFPDGWNSWYNDIEGTNMRTAFVKDLFPYIENNYRTIKKKEARAIGGQSMGAHGALVLSMGNPAYFNAVVLISPAITAKGKPLPNFVLNLMYRSNLTNVYGKPFSQEKWDANSYHSLLPNYVSQAHRANFLILTGRTDIVTPVMNTLNLHRNLNEYNLTNTYKIYEAAAHDWLFWGSTWKLTLPFLNKNLVFSQ
ncbi:MAG: alpha/beta hydrolase [Brevinema sp.]